MGNDCSSCSPCNVTPADAFDSSGNSRGPNTYPPQHYQQEEIQQETETLIINNNYNNTTGYNKVPQNINVERLETESKINEKSHLMIIDRVNSNNINNINRNNLLSPGVQVISPSPTPDITTDCTTDFTTSDGGTDGGASDITPNPTDDDDEEYGPGQEQPHHKLLRYKEARNSWSRKSLSDLYGDMHKQFSLLNDIQKLEDKSLQQDGFLNENDSERLMTLRLQLSRQDSEVDRRQQNEVKKEMQMLDRLRTSINNDEPFTSSSDMDTDNNNINNKKLNSIAGRGVNGLNNYNNNKNMARSPTGSIARIR